MSAAPIRVLWLKDNRSGHINKVQGFLSSLAGVVPLDVTVWRVRWRFPALRHIVGRLNGTRFAPPPSWVLRDFPPPGDFDLIISAGGLTQWPNAWLARHLHLPNVYIGSPHHFPPTAFTLIPLTDPPHENPPFFKLALVPSEVSPDSARLCAREHFPALGEKTGWTLLVGGDGEGLKWSDEDFHHLTDRFLEAAATAGQNVFVATSRRTPERVETALRQRCGQFPGFIAGAWFHAAGGQPPVLALLGAANRIFVTADSISMTNEAVASGVPAVSVYPKDGAPNPRHEVQASRLERDGRLARWSLAQAQSLAAIQPDGGWRLISGDLHAEFAEQALQLLGLAPTRRQSHP